MSSFPQHRSGLTGKNKGLSQFTVNKANNKAFQVLRKKVTLFKAVYVTKKFWNLTLKRSLATVKRKIKGLHTMACNSYLHRLVPSFFSFFSVKVNHDIQYTNITFIWINPFGSFFFFWQHFQADLKLANMLWETLKFCCKRRTLPKLICSSLFQQAEC